MLLGCATDNAMVQMKYGASIVIWDGLCGNDRRYVVVHEMAHHLCDWRH